MKKQKVALTLAFAMAISTITNCVLPSNLERGLEGGVKKEVKLVVQNETPFEKFVKNAEVTKQLREQKEKEEKRKAEESKRKTETALKKDVVDHEVINIICSAYTLDPKECGGNSGKTASGIRPYVGVCAIPRNYKLGTTVVVCGLEKYIGVNTLKGCDYGNPNYIRQVNNNTIKIDVFMDSKEKAVNFGIRTFQGYIIKK